MITLIILSLVGVVISVLVGMTWYSPATPMGKLHMKYLGMDKLSAEEQKKKMEEVKPTMPKMYAAQMLLSLLMSFSVVFVTSESIHNGLPFPMALGFCVMNWFCFMVPAIGGGILWSNCDRTIAWQKFFSDIAMYLVTILLISVLTSFFS